MFRTFRFPYINVVKTESGPKNDINVFDHLGFGYEHDVWTNSFHHQFSRSMVAQASLLGLVQYFFMFFRDLEKSIGVIFFTTHSRTFLVEQSLVIKPKIRSA